MKENINRDTEALSLRAGGLEAPGYGSQSARKLQANDIKWVIANEQSKLNERLAKWLGGRMKIRTDIKGFTSRPSDEENED